MAEIRVMRGLAGSFGGMAELDKEPPVSWLVKDWLAARELSVLYGQGGTFKSYIALGWTLQLARDQVPVLYIAAEGTSGLRSRVDAWMAARSRYGEQLPHWHYYNANVHVDNPNDLGMWAEAMRKYLKGHKQEAKLVVVDTMARNFAGDENIAKDVGQFVEGCEQLRRDVGCAVLVIHHMGVSTGRERGTAALRNATFAMFKTSDPRYNQTGGGSVQLECDRMKDAPLPKAVRVRLDTVALDPNEHGDVFRMSQAMRSWPPRRGAKPRKGVIES